MDGLMPEPTISAAPVVVPPCWRKQVESLSRRLSQISVPSEKVAERAEIVAALRQLMNCDGPTHEHGAVINGKEVLAG
jgi:hypothetical protein